MKNVVVIEKYYLLQAGIQALVQEIPGLFLSKSWLGDEPHLTEIILKHKPDLILVNPFSLSGENISLPGKFRSSRNTKVLALLHNKDKSQSISGFDDLLFYEEDRFILEQKIRRQAGNVQNPGTNHQELSPREITILRWIVKGLTHQEIADKLFLSIHTVNTHRKNINKKLGIKTVSGLSVYAIMNHLIPMEELAEK